MKLPLAIVAVSAAIAAIDPTTAPPPDHPAIRYSEDTAGNRIARLAARLEKGTAKLAYDPDHGYLRDFLRQLEVDPASQVLVFSKTSFQAVRISPRTPRALYHNDDVAIGWVRGGDVIEIAAADPRVGVAFYTLDQEEVPRPRIERHGNACVQCHLSSATLSVPGLMVRSVCPDRSGMALFPGPSYITDHRSPLDRRWGGWYVTGTHGPTKHMGNVFVEKGEPARTLDTAKGANITDLKGSFDTGAYLSPYSDLVSLMLLEHQTTMVNLISRVNYEALAAPPGRKNAGADAIEELVRYMLFADEAQLDAPLTGASTFASTFAKKGPRDRKGRSLRDLDLSRRILRYPCSYLIYSEQFDGLPAATRDRIYRRMWEVLTGRDRTAAFARLAENDRRAVFEILSETKHGLPAYWSR